ncbi:YkgJ family cysteine cluster protein [Parahaliea aestuarii]|uniref:YkgJ family cysteine cluster protein n=1 Tax=Parahaliea aestuarii TaxID=1852021 RepID=A0A5C9A3Z3_9GAMM|nr:YkgJ family cysteine cluster protein [Parahaliea aestuarii]TXS94714.1 YkgJ family cysteine cluster protein [Parahaliea aestuarii]
MQRLRELARLVEAVFEELESTFAGYQRRTGLNCTSGCGACCNNPEVEASPLEMLPLALDLFDRGLAENTLTSLDNYSGFSCIHFVRHSLDGSRGECGIYRQRPSLCRMFGAAGVSGKFGQPRLSVCRSIKEEQPAAHLLALTNLDDDPPPRMSEGKEKVRQLDHSLGQRDFPINEALRAALEKVLLLACYSNEVPSDQVA